MKRVLYYPLVMIAGVALLLGLLLGVRILLGSAVSPSVGVEVGHPIPDFRLVALDGQIKSKADFEGHPLVLNFWASWCAPCRDEMPLLQRLYETHVDEINVVGINYAEARSRVLDFVQSLGISFPILLDEDGKVNDLYQVPGYPLTLFVNQNGVLIAYHLGQLTPEMLSDYLRVLGVVP
ncbi:TlpA disulfide reductase family protein [uncultured Thermanaerothrix sp.]|uniref:TlpA family protein disulfide reductase n=1 Tax=uncultured Thermanaerothrix sp. TaxID=1195149 RepID=UPI002636036F|nr:TlpA disulfide reductase family protein [uncultured Thermanaerothrix sp.]